MQDLKAQIAQQMKHKLYSALADGSEKFPNISFQSKEQTKVISPVITEHENNLSEKISKCTLCPLSQTRKKVFVQKLISPKKYFILSDFPESEEENSCAKTIYSDKSTSVLIVKLIEKLGILNESYLSYALKCVPEKGLPQNSLSICATSNVKEELNCVQPDFIFCFGQKALKSLAFLEYKISIMSLTENFSQFKISLPSKTCEVFFLSSSQEMQLFPVWRGQVWQALKQFH